MQVLLVTATQNIVAASRLSGRVELVILLRCGGQTVEVRVWVSLGGRDHGVNVCVMKVTLLLGQVVWRREVGGLEVRRWRMRETAARAEGGGAHGAADARDGPQAARVARDEVSALL